MHHISEGTSSFTQGFCFSELSDVVQVPEHTVGPCTSLLLSEMMNDGGSKKDQEEKVMKINPQLNYTLTTHPTTVSPSTTTTGSSVPSSINQNQGKN